MTLEAATDTIPPGWYSDPTNEEAKRWWDGSGWTQHVSIAAAETTAAPVAPAVSEYTPLQPLGNTGTSPQFRANIHNTSSRTSDYTLDRAHQVKKSNTAAWAALLLGAVAVALSLVHLDPTVGTFTVAAVGIAALTLGIVGLRAYTAGRATNVVAPILGVLLALVGMGVMAFGVYAIYSAPASSATGTVTQPISTSQVGTDPGTNAAATHARKILMNDVRSINRSMKAVRGHSTLWPAKLSVDPVRGTVITGTGRRLGTVPVGSTVAYSTSPDGTGYTLTVSNPDVNVGVRYTSATFEYTTF
jgi:hypothetical protein